MKTYSCRFDIVPVLLVSVTELSTKLFPASLLYLTYTLPLMPQPKKQYINRKFVMARSAAEALMLTFYNDYSILMSSSSSKVVVPQDEGDFDRHSPISTI
jgi:hypothetical protein